MPTHLPTVLRRALSAATLPALCVLTAVGAWGFAPAALAATAGPASGDAKGPQLVRLGEGVVLASPRLQLLRVGDAPLAERMQAFVEAFAASGAWREMTAEYGVGPLTVAPTQQLTSPFVGPVVDADDDAGELGPSAVETLLAAALAGGASADTVYVVLLPQGVVASPSAEVPDACAAHVWAWHSASDVRVQGREVVVPYVVLPACAATGTISEIDRKTAALSHALVQAVTNPTARGIGGVDAAHVASELASGDSEIGNLCTQALYRSASWLARPLGLPFAVAPVWSNAASRAGRQPCVPVAGNANYFRAEAQLVQAVDVALDGATRTVHTPGVALVPGAEALVPVRFVSAAGEPPWSVGAEEVGSGDLTLALSHAEGQAGDVVTLRLRLADEPEREQLLVRLTSRRGEVAFSTYFVVRVRKGP